MANIAIFYKKSVFFLYLLKLFTFICYGLGMFFKNLSFDLSNNLNRSEFYAHFLSGNQF